MITGRNYLDAESSDEDSPGKPRRVTDETLQVSAKPRVSYSTDELEALTNYIKGLITLRDLQPSDWNKSVITAIQEFIQYPDERILSIYDCGGLIGSLNFPTVPVHELTYFVRTNDEIFTSKNLPDTILFGTSNSNVESTISQLMETMLAPSFFIITRWPESVKADFCNMLHDYLCHLTDLRYKMHGLTVMYLPLEGNKLHYKDASTNQEFVKRLEKIVVQWTRQIKLALVDQQQLTNYELLTLYDEYDFWIYRYKNLCGLNYQLKNPIAQHVVEILINAESTCVVQFVTLSMDIDKGIKEAKSNIMYLDILKNPCIELNNCSSPESVALHITTILHLLSFVGLQSPYFNTTKRITHLFELLENQIIMLCCKFINLKMILEQKKSQSGIKITKRCIDLCENYKKIVNTFDELFWRAKNLDIIIKFENIEIFLGRCNDIIEIFRAMIDFARLDETKNMPAPHFEGTLGHEHDKVCQKVENLFLEYLEIICHMHEKILDIQDASWQDDMFVFRSGMKDLEIIIENLMNIIFSNMNNVKEGISNLYALHMYMDRENLKTLFDFPITKVWRLFLSKIHSTKHELLKEINDTENIPNYSRQSLGLQLKINRLELTGCSLKEASWMNHCAISEKTQKQYDILNGSIKEKIQNLYNEWSNNISDNILSILDQPLMRQSIDRTQLESNLDITIVNLLREAYYWRINDFMMPVYVEIVIEKTEIIQFLSERVLMLVIKYNKIIKGLSDEEKELFKYLIDDLRRRLKTGRTKLTWNTEFVERYVDQCYEHVTKLDEFFRIYKICCCEIMKICENICDLSFINIKSNYTYKLSEFYDEILIQRDTVFKKIRNKYDEIIRYVLVVIEEYQKILKDNTVEWITYLENLDYLIEDSLRTSLQKSLSALYDVLHGTGKIEPSPFLLIEVTLVDNEITLVPSPNDIAKTISEMLNKSLEKFSSFLKLTSRFELISIGKLNYINSFQDYQTLIKLQKLLDAEMSKCFSLTRAYLKIWEPYKDLWKENIDEFTLKYTTLKPTSTSISSDIFRLSAISNNVNLQETVTTVHFVLIDCNHLKTELSDRCSLRLEKLRALSYDTLESHENIHDKIID